MLVSDLMVKAWTNFAKTGNPNTPESITLTPFNSWSSFTQVINRKGADIGLLTILANVLETRFLIRWIKNIY